MVLLERIELSASPLPRVCSPTELQQPTVGRRALQRGLPLSSIPPRGKGVRMSGAGKQSREERLAARLRENLRRRKAQARAIAADKPPLPKKEPER